MEELGRGEPGVSARCLALVEAVRECAREAILPLARSTVGSRKPDGSWFSAVDAAAQRMLAERLQPVAAHPVLGEEMDHDDQIDLWSRGASGLWCVDPIDGTTNFLNGVPFYAISVAHLMGGRADLGVVYSPANDEVFFAERGRGAYLNGERLPLRDAPDALSDCVAGVDFKRIPRLLGDRLATSPPYHSQRNFGCSALEWCYVAAGRLDLYLHGGQMLWDYAAGRLILEEAGGRFCTLTHDHFDGDNLWKRSVIAASSAPLFEAWRDWVRSHR